MYVTWSATFGELKTWKSPCHSSHPKSSNIAEQFKQSICKESQRSCFSSFWGAEGWGAFAALACCILQFELQNQWFRNRYQVLESSHFLCVPLDNLQDHKQMYCFRKNEFRSLGWCLLQANENTTAASTTNDTTAMTEDPDLLWV